MKTLNNLKVRDKIFHLQEGDIIYSNKEDQYTYEPSTFENQSKIPFKGFAINNKVIKIPKKYHKTINESTNLELIEEIPSHDPNREYLRFKKWIVKEVKKEKVSLKKLNNDKVYFISLSDDFHYESAEIIKETAKQIKLEKSLGRRFLQTINKTQDFNIVKSEYGHHFIYCFFEDFDYCKEVLYKSKKESLEESLEIAKKKLEKFNTNMEKEGF